MKELKRVIKKYYKLLIILIILGILLNIKFPYYIEAPGGVDNINKKIIIDGYKFSGSINSTYVSEWETTIPTLIMSLFNKDSKIIPYKELISSNETTKDYDKRDKILIEEAVSDAIHVGYTYSNSNLNIKNNHILVASVSEKSKTALTIGDEILEINNKKIKSKEDINSIVKSSNIGDRLNIKVKNKKKENNRIAEIIKLDGENKIGIIVSEINDYELYPNIKVNLDKNESGPSSGFMMALFIYNSLTKEDLTKERKIVGTGTIDKEGNIGRIDGVEFKLKSAVKAKTDIFLVPNDENYSEAMKLKNKYNYDIEIKGVSTFDEAIEYLKNN